VGPRAGLDVMQKTKISYPYQKSNPDSSVVNPVAQELYRLSCPGLHVLIIISVMDTEE
jgi:hypothetical protein